MFENDVTQLKQQKSKSRYYIGQHRCKVSVVVSGMQLLRLRSAIAIHRHHPPQRAVLSQICCFGEHKVVCCYVMTLV